LIEKGWDPAYGGRPLRRAVQKEIEDPLSLLLLETEFPAGTVFAAEARNGKIILKARPPQDQSARPASDPVEAGAVTAE
jgi:ATP-dependent Clp protease ATP-binding subunit ClpC